MPSVRDDLRLAARSLLRRPGHTAVALLTIALAIAGNAAIFSILKAVLLEPLPYAQPERLITIDVKSTRGFYISTSIPNYRDWRDRTRSFDRYGGAADWGFILTGRGQAEVIAAEAVIGDLFGVLELEPGIGTLFGASETEPGSPATAVLGERFWRTRLGADLTVVGQTLVLDGRPHLVTGVLAADADYPNPDVDVYVPMGSIPGLPFDDRESSFGTRAVARLAPGVTMALAQEDLNRATRSVAEEIGRAMPQPEVRSLTELFVGDVRPRIWILSGAVAFVLLIAVANVGNLALARAEDRRREVAVRTALGAGRAALFRTLLSESVLVSLAAGVLGLVLAYGVVRLAVPLLPDSVPLALRERIGVDLGVAAFTFALAALTGLLAGMLPALRGGNTDPARELREGTRGTGAADRQRLRAGLVVVEIALALVLLIGAGLMLQSLRNLGNVDKGFSDAGVLTARVPLTPERYDSKERWRGFYDELTTRLDALPGVRRSAVALLLPLAQRSWEMGILPDNVPYERDQLQSVLYNIVSPGYFEAMGLTLLRGTLFTGAERDDTPPVAVIDETMAARFWPGDDPIGKRIAVEEAEGSTRERPLPVYRAVVGVVKNVRHYELASRSRIQMYLPVAQTPRRGPTLNVIVKTEGAEPGSLMPALAREIAAMDRDVPLTNAQPLGAYVSAELSASRAMSTVLAVFGSLALALAAVGIFGVMSYMVLRRTKEIGIRVALGAAPGQIAVWVARLGGTIAAAGIAAGLLGAVALSRVLRTLLYDVSPLSPGLYAALAALLLGVAALAVYVPARRAMGVDPVVVLNSEN